MPIGKYRKRIPRLRQEVTSTPGSALRRVRNDVAVVRPIVINFFQSGV